MRERQRQIISFTKFNHQPPTVATFSVHSTTIFAFKHVLILYTYCRCYLSLKQWWCSYSSHVFFLGSMWLWYASKLKLFPKVEVCYPCDAAIPLVVINTWIFLSQFHLFNFSLYIYKCWFWFPFAWLFMLNAPSDQTWTWLKISKW